MREFAHKKETLLHIVKFDVNTQHTQRTPPPHAAPEPAFEADKRDVAAIFRDRMTLLIAKRGQSLSAFARDIGIDRSALSQFLASGSTRLPRAETLAAISRTCGVSLDWLLGLIASDSLGAETAPMLEIEPAAPDNGELLSRWHREAMGYKIRYVPATLPDLLRTEAVARHEFRGRDETDFQLRERQAREQLTYSRRPETDMEVCMPMQRLELFAQGHGIWEHLALGDRIEQLETMISLIDEMYPTFRLFLFDERQYFASPYTVFGPKRAALYMGSTYVVINSVDHIQALTRHFDRLIRFATFGPDRTARHIEVLLARLKGDA